MRAFGILAAAIAFGFPGAGLTEESRPKTPIEIAAIYNLSGAQSDLDSASLLGARLAIDEANRSGGVSGRSLRMIVGEGNSDPGNVAAITQALIDAHGETAAFIGLSDTDMVLAAAPLVARSGRAFVTSGATSPDLPSQVPDKLFLACFGDNVQAAAAAEWAYQARGARTVAILSNETMSYTRLLSGYFVARFKELGGRVTSAESYGSGGLDDAIARLGPADVVFAAVSPDEVIETIHRIRASGFRGPILGGDGYDLGSVWTENPDIEGVYFTTHAFLGADSTDARVQNFRAAFVGAYPGRTPDAFAALGYDAANLVIAAIGRAGTDDPREVLAAIAETKDFEGVTGSISYAGSSHIPLKTVSILKVEHGKVGLETRFVPAKPPEP